MARLFISQERLDAWNEDNRVLVAGDTMTLVEDGRSFAITPAVRFLRVSGGDPDPNQLLGTVRGEEDLAALGAEHYMDSVILGDTAYDVQCGFLGDPQPRDSDRG